MSEISYYRREQIKHLEREQKRRMKRWRKLAKWAARLEMRSAYFRNAAHAEADKMIDIAERIEAMRRGD